MIRGGGRQTMVFWVRDGFCVICANKDLGGRGLENWLKGYFIIFSAHLKACSVFFPPKGLWVDFVPPKT